MIARMTDSQDTRDTQSMTSFTNTPRISVMTVLVRNSARILMAGMMAAAIPLPLVAQGGGSGQGRPAQRSGQGAQFDFTDADIRSVIAAIAAAGDLNVVYGDIPPRTVSLRMRSPVGREGYLALLRSVAQSNGLRVTEDGDLITIAAVAPPQQRGSNEQLSPFANAELFVYRLKHANATRLAGVLQAIFSGGPVPTGQTGFSQQTLGSQIRNQFQGGGGGFNRGGGGGFNVQINPGGGGFQGGGAGGFAGMIQRAMQGQGGAVPAGVLSGQVIIVPEDATNTLLIRANPEDWDIIRQAIEAVDLRPLQVLIEVMIAEVRRSDDLNVGVSADASNDRTFSGRTRGSGRLRGADTSSNFVFDFTRFGAVDVNVALSALKSRGDVRILSLPLVFAQNNQESRLLVGTQRPFVQTFRTLATDNAARDQVVQYRDVGTSLAILPTINPDGYVNLMVQQEVSSATNEVQFGAPVISTREAMASLFVKDGQTVVVGGLTDNQEEKTRSGIPVLSSLPGIGWLFGSTQKTNIRTELFLFLTPHIVQIDRDVERIRNEIQQKSPLLRDVPVEPLITSPMDTTAPKRPVIVEPQRRNQEQQPIPFPFPIRQRPGWPGQPGQPGQPTPQPGNPQQPVPVPPPPPPPAPDSGEQPPPETPTDEEDVVPAEATSSASQLPAAKRAVQVDGLSILGIPSSAQQSDSTATQVRAQGADNTTAKKSSK
jgi:type II secretory pathway component GspD/PulD (secretin)